MLPYPYPDGRVSSHLLQLDPSLASGIQDSIQENHQGLDNEKVRERFPVIPLVPVAVFDWFRIPDQSQRLFWIALSLEKNVSLFVAIYHCNDLKCYR